MAKTKSKIAAARLAPSIAHGRYEPVDQIWCKSVKKLTEIYLLVFFKMAAAAILNFTES